MITVENAIEGWSDWPSQDSALAYAEGAAQLEKRDTKPVTISRRTFG